VKLVPARPHRVVRAAGSGTQREAPQMRSASLAFSDQPRRSPPRYCSVVEEELLELVPELVPEPLLESAAGGAPGPP